MRNLVCGVLGTSFSIFANPYALRMSTLPSRAIRMAPLNRPALTSLDIYSSNFAVSCCAGVLMTQRR